MASLSESENPDLPDDVVHNILLRLPARDLSRFKCVSKPWLSLISSPQFVKDHLRRSTTAGQCGVLVFSPKARYATVSVESILVENEPKLIDFPELGRTIFEVVGSSGGLMCMTNQKGRVVVVNPATRKFRVLPKSGIREPITEPIIEYFYQYYTTGFGYDAENEDYKVVSVGFREAEIYSLRKNCWRKISPFQEKWTYRTLASKSSVGTNICVGGSIVFPSLTMIRIRDQFYLPLAITVFDFATETHKELLVPKAALDEVGGKGLCKLDECLCFFIICKAPTCLHIWMMKEFGLQESWTKLFRISFELGPSRSIDPSNLYLLWCSKEGELLMCVQNKFVVYKEKYDGSASYHVVQKNFYVFSLANVYVDSLVSLDAEDWTQA